MEAGNDGGPSHGPRRGSGRRDEALEGVGAPSRVLVVGAGSVGRRHARNLQTLGAEVHVVRARPELAPALSRELGVPVHASLAEGFDAKPEAVVVADRTDRHVATSLEAARRGLPIYVEKPLGASMDGVDELRRLVASRGVVVEIGCMMRFHPLLSSVKRLLDEGSLGRAWSAQATVGQWLPDWRATSYEESTSARAERGGGVTLDLVHDVDYLVWWFGRVREVAAFLDKRSDLDLDVEDVSNLLLRFESGVVASVHMDYLRPRYRRAAEVVCANACATWDGVAETLTVERRGTADSSVQRPPAGFERNDMFLAHMRRFLERVRSGGPPAVSLDDGVHVLEVALAAKRASAEGRTIRL